MIDFNTFIQSKEYDLAMFKTHCETLKVGTIPLYDRQTKSVYYVKSFEELAKNYFPKLDMGTKLKIKRQVGL